MYPGRRDTAKGRCLFEPYREGEALSRFRLLPVLSFTVFHIMRKILLLLWLVFGMTAFSLTARKSKPEIPWKHGKLQVSENGRYLQHADGTPFFYLGETGWLMPERLNRDEVGF